MADAQRETPRQRRRHRRRRRLIVGGLVTVLVLAGAGTAWAARRSSGTDYRTAAVTRASVAQTVSADSSLSVRRTATLAFASAGTVNSVRVAVGSTVHAGEVVATIDPADLDDAVTQAKAAVAQAQQKLTDDEDAESSSSSDTTSTSSYVALTPTAATPSGSSSSAPTRPTSGSSGSSGSSSGSGSGGILKAQAAVVAAQHALDKAVSAQDGAVRTLVSACTASTEKTPATAKVTAEPDGTVTGHVGAAAAVVTLEPTSGGSATTQQVPAGDDYTFSDLTAGTTYSLQILSTAIDTGACSSAVATVRTDEQAVDAAKTKLDAAVPALTKAVAASEKSASGSGAAGSGSGASGSGSGASGSGYGSGSSGTGNTAGGSSSTGGTTRSGSSSSTTSTTITAEQIAADAKSIDSAEATVTLRESQVANARLTSPISGKVAAVAITSGDSVSASSSTSTITVVGNGTLAADLDIPAANIDLVKAGEKAQITVDGHATPYAGTVGYVGSLASSSSSGSTVTYPVTVTLDSAHPALYDGMGATVSIAVGSSRNVLTVPLSAVHTIGTRHFVDVDAGGKVTVTSVTEGTVGADRVQITKGLSAGQRVVLADVGAAVPSATTSTNGRSGSSLGGLSGGGLSGGGGFGGGGFGGGPPGGR